MLNTYVFHLYQQSSTYMTNHLEGMQAEPAEADRPPRQQMQDDRIGITQGRIQVLKMKGGNKGNTTPYTARYEDPC